MRNVPLFSPFSMSAYAELYETLALLEPDETYALMSRLTAAERQGPISARSELMKQQVRPKLALAPGVFEVCSMDEASEQFKNYVLDLNLDTAFLGTYMNNRDLVAEGIINLGNIDIFDDAVRNDRPVLLLPMHIGPVYGSLPVLAKRAPVTTLYHNLPFDELRSAYFSEVDLEGISVPRPELGKECIDVLSRGRVLSFFPEFDPSGPGRLHVEVPLLGTRVLAPSGAALISQRTGAQLLPFVFVRTAPARYRFEFGTPISVSAGSEGRLAATTELFGFLESQLRQNGPGAWEMWWEFEQMLAPSPVGAR